MKRNKIYFNQIYNLRAIRMFVVMFRAFVAIKIFRKLKTQHSDDAFEVTIKHNLKGMFQCNDRMNLLINPLSVIETVNENSKVLVIGPRNENDIFLLLAKGFQLKNIVGLDLISYSKYIKIGDMHQMDFDDNTFDVILFGWTLSYSAQPQKAINEIIRVCKSEAIIAIGVEYGIPVAHTVDKITGYVIQEFDRLEKRINSTDSILELFKNVKHDVYFKHDAPNKIYHDEFINKDVSNVSVILSIEK